MALLGKLLKKKREELRLTLREVEKKTGISNAYLSQIENTKINTPSPIILKKLSEVYQTSYQHLMEITGYPVSMEEKKKVYFKTSKGFEKLSNAEEKELLDYLQFMRQRRIK